VNARAAGVAGLVVGTFLRSAPSRGDVQEPIAEPPRPAPAETTERIESRSCGDALRVSTVCSSVFGLRGSATSAQGVPASDGVGLMVWSDGENFAHGPVMNAHGVHRLALGGGGAGLEGTLLGGFTGGFRLPAGDHHGPVFRAGALGYVRGNDSFYGSLLELPRVEVGYQVTYPTLIFELGMSSGAALIGRQRIGDATTRHIGSGLEVGGYASARIPWFRIAFGAMRLPSADDIATPVWALDGTLCALGSPIAICADTRLTVADEIAFGTDVVSQARSFYTGLAVGFTAGR
jgi:hypothetical protein